MVESVLMISAMPSSGDIRVPIIPEPTTTVTNKKVPKNSANTVFRNEVWMAMPKTLGVKSDQEVNGYFAIVIKTSLRFRKPGFQGGSNLAQERLPTVLRFAACTAANN